MTTGRPGFNGMVSYLQQHPECRVLLVEKDGPSLTEILRITSRLTSWTWRSTFVKENVILTKDSRSSEKFMHGIKVLMAKNYIDNLSEEVKRACARKQRSGSGPRFRRLAT